RNFARAAPFGVYRNSGSSVRLPTLVTCPIAISATTFSRTRPAPGDGLPGRGGRAFWYPTSCRALHHLEPDHVVGQVQPPVELGERRRVGLELDHEVVALGLVGDLVRQAPAAPAIQLPDLALAVGE